MASDPDDRSAAERKPLPFEPGAARKKRADAKPVQAELPAQTRADTSVGVMPKEVGQRIGRRIAVFCGVPTLLGFSSFLGSYGLIQSGVSVPNFAVVLVSMGLLGLGVLGLSYGAISASWDEGRPGSRLGWEEFRKNLGYLTEAWKSQKH